MGADDHANVAAAAIGMQGRAPQALQVVRVRRAGVDGDKAGMAVTHQITVGAGAGHEAGVGRGQALHIAQQGHGPFGLPVQRVVRLHARGADQGELAKGHVVLQEPGCNAALQAGALLRGFGSGG